jgi:hypothetical protein
MGCVCQKTSRAWRSGARPHGRKRKKRKEKWKWANLGFAREREKLAGLGWLGPLPGRRGRRQGQLGWPASKVSAQSKCRV